MSTKNTLTHQVKFKRVTCATLVMLALQLPIQAQTTVADPTGLTDTTGLVNYTLTSAVGTVGVPAFSANSITMSNPLGGATVPGATSFSINTLSSVGMNTTNTWQIGGTVAAQSINAGSTNTLAIVTPSDGNGRILINATIKNGENPTAVTIPNSSTGRVTFGANNTYTGTTTIGTGGSLQIGNNNSTGSFGTGNVINGGTINFRRGGSNYEVANAISGSGGVTINNSTVTTTFTGANSYAGSTIIFASTLGVGANNALSSASALDVRSGATLAMNSFTASASALTFNAGGKLSFSLGTAGNTTALLSLDGNLTKGGTGTYTIDLSGGQMGTYKLISFSGTSTSFASGDFTALLSAGYAGSFSLNSNDLSYTISAIPEPSTYASLAGLAILGWACTRRRRS